METKDFKGYVDDKLKYIFPSDWVTHIDVRSDGFLVYYIDSTENTPTTDSIKILKANKIEIK